MDRIGLRAILCFGLLGCIGVLLMARLVHLQITSAPANRGSVDGQRSRKTDMPAPRGTIVDRHHQLLAYDRPVLEVRAEAYVTLTDGQRAAGLEKFAAELAGDLAYALAAEPSGRGAAQDRAREQLQQRILACRERESDLRKLSPEKQGGPDRWRRRVDILVGSEVESAAVLRRLREVDAARDYLYLHYLRGYVRTYPFRDYTYGPVGFVGKQDLGGGQTGDVFRGMEAFSGLRPGAAGKIWAWQDAAAQRYWTGWVEQPEPQAVLQSTLDLELQKAAHEELKRAVEAVESKYQSPPHWGAMCLAEIETGDILALASYRSGVPSPKVAAFSPIQCLCPPGSVVKPLVFSLALERGLIDWDGETIDCRPTNHKGWRLPGRYIEDSHTCGEIPPREVLVQSSNIGAVRVGLRLGQGGMADYLEHYRFATPTATRLPGEAAGMLARSKERIRGMRDREFAVWTGPSLSMGYEYNITPVQLLRAYLILLSGRSRDLRLFRRITRHGEIVDVPGPPAGERFLSERTVATLRDAMTGVVSGDPQATGRHVYAELMELAGEVPVAGKTGTSEYEEIIDGQSVTVRTASFAGFAPLDRPRFVAVCVLQKPKAAHFWGGSYAGPPAGRLLLHALSQPSRRRAGDSQVSAGLLVGGVATTRHR